MSDASQGLKVGQVVTIGSEALVEYRYRVGEVCDEHMGEVHVWVRGDSSARWFLAKDVHPLPAGIALGADVQTYDRSTGAAGRLAGPMPASRSSEAESDDCETCGGDGWYTSPDDSDAEVTCDACGGTGKCPESCESKDTAGHPVPRSNEAVPAEPTVRCWVCKRDVPESMTKCIAGVGTQCTDGSTCREIQARRRGVFPSIDVDGVTYSIGDVRIMRDSAREHERCARDLDKVVAKSDEKRAREWLSTMPLWGTTARISGRSYKDGLVTSLAKAFAAARTAKATSEKCPHGLALGLCFEQPCFRDARRTDSAESEKLTVPRSGTAVQEHGSSS